MVFCGRVPGQSSQRGGIVGKKQLPAGIWFPVYANFIEDEKFDGLSLTSIGLWVCGLAFCKRNKTNGFIRQSALNKLSTCYQRDINAHATRLQRAGLWTPTRSQRATGWQIVNYRKYNCFEPLDAELEIDAVQKRERVEKSREEIEDIYTEKFLENLDEVCQAGFPNFGMLVGKAAATLMRLLPISSEEFALGLDASRGKSWPYFAKVLESIREERAKPPPQKSQTAKSRHKTFDQLSAEVMEIYDENGNLRSNQ